jgi:hypothetical protein
MGILSPRLQSFFSPISVAFSIRSKHLHELSGLVQSRRDPNILWGHNDSGDSSRLFAIDKTGKILGSPKGIEVKKARNHDWEDIAQDARGNLYIADMGNNNNTRKDLGVYIFPEPNPTQQSVSGARFVPVYYPEQKPSTARTDPRFDCESLFFYRDYLYFLTKERSPGSLGLPSDTTTLYRLESKNSTSRNSTGKNNLGSGKTAPQPLQKVDTRSHLGGWVTGADVSPDEKYLAVLCHFPQPCVWLFALGKTGDKLLQGKAKQIKLEKVGQCEAICFENTQTLLIGNEDGKIFRLRV